MLQFTTFHYVFYICVILTGSKASNVYTQKVSTTDSPRVKGSSPVRGNFFAVFFLL